jgi:hypothetical protein
MGIEGGLAYGRLGYDDFFEAAKVMGRGAND